MFDYNQVRYAQTTASIYSIRPLRGAPVSAPLSWDEVEEGRVVPEDFTIRTMADRVAEVGDLAASLNEADQELPYL